MNICIEFHRATKQCRELSIGAHLDMYIQIGIDNDKWLKWLTCIDVVYKAYFHHKSKGTLYPLFHSQSARVAGNNNTAINKKKINVFQIVQYFILWNTKKYTPHKKNSSPHEIMWFAWQLVLVYHRLFLDHQHSVDVISHEINALQSEKF